MAEKKKTLTVLNNMGQPKRVRVLARIGEWVLHRTIHNERHYTVTHEPTRLAGPTWIKSWQRAKKALTAFASIPGDWSFTEQVAMSKRQHAAGKRLTKQFAKAEGHDTP